MERIGDLTAFYVPDGDGFASTELTRGPWDVDSQHGGPPCALLGRALEAAGAISPAQMVRISFEILRPVPIGRLAMTAEVVRGGRKVELIDGALTHEGTELIRARAWRIRTADVAVDPEPPEPPALPGPDGARPARYFDVDWDLGFQAAMDVRFLSGDFVEPGPGQAWMRMRVPLIEGEATTPLDRLIVAADGGNGVSAPLDYRRFSAINTDLGVSLRRLPRGDWICLDSVTYPGHHGVGLSDTVLHDRDGMVARGTQSLLVYER
ncbi:MAG: thioesterase family protein [Thermoleophilaceae bacterium]